MNGWLNIYKPRGISSAKVVSKVKHELGGVKVGHAGTLDPLAEGILPLAIGEATKLIHFLIDAHKAYEFVVQFGCDSSTGDAEGIHFNYTTKKVEHEYLNEKIFHFIGKIKQKPHAFSAIKVNGTPSYKKARKGESVELAEREIEIYDLKLIDFNYEKQQAKFWCKCSKGTYIRSLAEDIALSLQNLGYVLLLSRLEVGKFSSNSSITINDQSSLQHFRDDLMRNIIDVDFILDDILVINVDNESALKIRQGKLLPVNFVTNDLVVVKNCNKILAYGLVDNGIFKVNRVLNL